MLRFAATAFATLAALLCASPALAAEAQTNTIAVMGDAEVLAPPDFATVEVGVISQNVKVGDALAENNAKMTQIVAALRQLGIADADMQTTNFEIAPKYGPQENNRYDPDVMRPVVGYYVSNTVIVTVTEMAKIPRVIDASVDAGANTSGQIEFRLRNPRASLDKVREAAIASALHKAQVFTAAAHLTLGRAISIVDNEARTEYNGRAGGTYGGNAEVVVVTGSRMPAPILPGLIKVTAQVTLVYRVQ